MLEKKNNTRIELKAVNLETPDFKRLSTFIMSQYGIKMPPIKKIMLQSRLQKRLKVLNLKSFSEYVDYLFSSQGLKDELPNMIDAVSTNKTDFFREKKHFDFLYSEGIEDYLKQTGKRKLTIWSAGCAIGEEPYSIAMTLQDFSIKKKFVDYQILATDISTSVLQLATIGIYSYEKAGLIPEYLWKDYLLKGKNSYRDKVRIVSELRNKISFQKFNLLSSSFDHLGKFDIIFCRNVVIYFERDIQYKLFKQFCQRLNPNGYLFLGHSESITGFTLPLKQIKPTIFTKFE
jgi:chemotaxis protein methyltransferase CheR